MNRFFSYLSQPKGTWFRAQLIIVVYEIVARISVFKPAIQWVWDLLKTEVYYIDGSCRSSGMCCSGLSLMIKGRQIDTLPDFLDVVAEDAVFSRFIPHLEANGEVRDFRCRCLGPDKRCTDYLNRPRLCHQYPFSAFMVHDHIINGCGYRVVRRSFSPLWIPRLTREKLLCTDHLNGIGA